MSLSYAWQDKDKHDTSLKYISVSLIFTHAFQSLYLRNMNWVNTYLNPFYRREYWGPSRLRCLMNIQTRIHASWLVGSVLSAKREWKEGKRVKQAKKKKGKTDWVVRRARNIEEGYASLSALVTESSKYKNTLHVSWPRARMNSLKRSEPWTHIPIPFHMCLEYVGALAFSNREN